MKAETEAHSEKEAWEAKLLFKLLRIKDFETRHVIAKLDLYRMDGIETQGTGQRPFQSVSMNQEH